MVMIIPAPKDPLQFAEEILHVISQGKGTNKIRGMAESQRDRIKAYFKEFTGHEYEVVTLPPIDTDAKADCGCKDDSCVTEEAPDKPDLKDDEAFEDDEGKEEIDASRGDDEINETSDVHLPVQTETESVPVEGQPIPEGDEDEDVHSKPAEPKTEESGSRKRKNKSKKNNSSKSN